MKRQKSNSWIVTRKDTGEAVLETFDAKLARMINRKTYRVQTAYKYLVDFNHKVKQGKAA